MRRVLVLIGAALAVLGSILLACGVRIASPWDSGASRTPVVVTLAPAAGRMPVVDAVPVVVYLPRLFEDESLGLQAVPRALPADGDHLRGLVEALIYGPTGDERAVDFQFAFDRRTALLATTVDAGVATIELGERIQRVHGRPYSELVYWSIVFTATEAPGVEAVRLLYRGVPLTELGAPPFAVPSEGRREAAPAWARPRSADAR